MNLQTLLQCITSQLRIFKIQTPHLYRLALNFISQIFVLLQTVLVIVHNWPILFLLRIIQNYSHRFQNVLLHPLRIHQCRFQTRFCLFSLTNTHFILLPQLLNHPSFMLINNLIKMPIILLYLSFLSLTHL
jgi:hypothetical protein